MYTMSHLPHTRIKAIKFHIAGDDEVIATSNVPITSHDLFRGPEPYPGGVYDGHLGTTDHGFRCQTCHNSKRDCLGHGGHLKVNYPLLQSVPINEIRKWLRVICFKCGECILDPSEYSGVKREQRLTVAAKNNKLGRKCRACGEPHPVLSKADDNKFTYKAEIFEDGKQVSKYIMYPHMMKKVLDSITDATVLQLGKPLESHPRKFITTAPRIPTVVIRPDVRKMGGGRSTNDDMTTLLKNLVKKNEALPAIIPDQIDDKLAKVIIDFQSLYYTYIRGGSGKKGGVTGPTNSLATRLRGKQGRFRKTLLGKRVADSARATVVGDVQLKLTEVGIPVRHAKTLQIEETVQQYNKQRMMTYILNGTKRYPGCTKVINHETGVEHSVDKLDDTFKLNIGDIVLRDMVTGDPIMFNRQPSLKPSNMVELDVVVCEDPESLVFRINVLDCVLLDADFRSCLTPF